MPVQYPKKIFIDSDNCLPGGTPGDFRILCRVNSTVPYDRICLLNAAIPKSYYVVQDSYNEFVLHEGLSSVTLSIPAGNYGATTFATALRALLIANSPNMWTYSVGFSMRSGKFTFGVSGNSGQPSFQFLSGSVSKIHENFGFAAGSTNTFTSDSLESTRVIKMIAEPTLFVRSDLAASADNTDILQEIYTARDSDLSVIVFQQQNIEANSKPLVDFKTNGTFELHLYITDENGLRIDFNGQNIVATVLLYCDRYVREDLYFQYMALLKENSKIQKEQQRIREPTGMHPSLNPPLHDPRAQQGGLKGDLGPPYTLPDGDLLSPDSPREQLEQPVANL